jgi:hypothetical protein
MTPWALVQTPIGRAAASCPGGSHDRPPSRSLSQPPATAADWTSLARAVPCHWPARRIGRQWSTGSAGLMPLAGLPVPRGRTGCPAGYQSCMCPARGRALCPVHGWPTGWRRGWREAGQPLQPIHAGTAAPRAGPAALPCQRAVPEDSTRMAPSGDARSRRRLVVFLPGSAPPRSGPPLLPGPDMAAAEEITVKHIRIRRLRARR